MYSGAICSGNFDWEEPRSTKITNKKVFVDVIQCARCQKNQNHLQFEQLINHADYWAWFGVCPVKHQPIFMRIQPEVC